MFSILDQLDQVIRENVAPLYPNKVVGPTMFPLSRGTLITLKGKPEIVYQVDRWDYKRDNVRYYQLSRSSGSGRPTLRCNVREDVILAYYDVVSF